MKKLKYLKYQIGLYFGVQGTIKLVMYNNKTVIVLQLQRLLVWWHHIYILNPGLDRMEEMIQYHFYCPRIRSAFQNKFNKC